MTPSSGAFSSGKNSIYEKQPICTLKAWLQAVVNPPWMQCCTPTEPRFDRHGNLLCWAH